VIEAPPADVSLLARGSAVTRFGLMLQRNAPWLPVGGESLLRLNTRCWETFHVVRKNEVNLINIVTFARPVRSVRRGM